MQRPRLGAKKYCILLATFLAFTNHTIRAMNKEFKRGFASVFSFANNDKTRQRIPMLSTEDRMRRNWEIVGSAFMSRIHPT